MSNVKRFPVKRRDYLDSGEPQEPVRKRKKLVWRNPLRTMVVAFVLANIFVVGYFAFNQQMQLRALEQDISALVDTKESLLEEKQELRQNLDSVSDERIVEKIAREQLGLIMPGEKLLIIRE